MGFNEHGGSKVWAAALAALTGVAVSCGGDVELQDEGAPAGSAGEALFTRPGSPPAGRWKGPGRGAGMSPELRAAFLASVQHGAPKEYSLIQEGPGRVRGRNERHMLEALFEAGTMTLTGPAGAWEMSLATDAIGCEGSLDAVAEASPEASKNRLEYRRGGVTEWYENGQLGVEQGFTLAEPPACDGKKQIALRLGGDLRAELVDEDGDGRGDSVALRDAGGRSVLYYRDLHVKDAAGNQVPAWLSLSASPGGARLSIHIDDSGARYPLEVDPLMATQIAELTAPDGQLNDSFGGAVASVAIDGDTALVGAPNDSNANGSSAGGVYVFVRNAGVWTFQTKLLANPGLSSDFFGTAVALSGDTAVVGAPGSYVGGSGHVYMFARSGGVWTQQAVFYGNYADNLGASVAISGDTALAGRPGTYFQIWDGVGGVTIYKRSNGQWSFSGSIQPPGFPGTLEENAHFGATVALSNDTALVGWPQRDRSGIVDAGQVNVYVQSGGSWNFQDTLLANDAQTNDRFGSAIALSGNTAVIGVPLNDNVKGTDAGAAYVFARIAGLWVGQGKLLANDGAANDLLGISVAVINDTAVLGSFQHDTPAGTDAGAAYVFTRSGNAWTQQLQLTAGDAAMGDEFGASVAVSADTAIVGAPDRDALGSNSGAAYVFSLKLAQGDACSSAVQCASGQCVDGVCCDTACGGGAADCQACSVAAGAAVNGTCAPIAAGTPCRASAGTCDAAEACDGVNPACPADTKVAAGTPCRAAFGACDATETCDGAGNDCPADGVLPVGTPCRASAGLCDAAETCNGSSPACPADGKLPPGTPCRASAGLCDAPETCDGSGNACPPDGKVAAGTPCRAAAGLCDAAEACDGSSDACPADAKMAAGTPCRAAAGLCDAAEACDGSSNACPADAKMAAGTPCRAAAGLCDVAEACDGSSNACPADLKVAAGIECRKAAGDCDVAEACDGSSGACPADLKVKAGVECRKAAGDCDVAESCDGSNVACPADAPAPDGAPCAGGMCQSGVCESGSGGSGGSGTGGSTSGSGAGGTGGSSSGGSSSGGSSSGGSTGGSSTGGSSTGGSSTGGSSTGGSTGSSSTGGNDTTSSSTGGNDTTSSSTGGNDTTSSGGSTNGDQSGACGCRTAGGTAPIEGSGALLLAALGLALRPARRRTRRAAK
jgi:hypothetical protein